MSKTVFITGGTGGLGSAIAHAFANVGYRVAVGYNSSQEKANELIGKLKGDGHISVKCTTNDTDSIKSAKVEVEKQFTTLDVLINNAGFTKFIEHTDLKSLDDKLFDDIFQVNVRGIFACIREFESLFNDGSCIVNISSIAGKTAIGSNIAYCASKSAVDNITKSLARSLSPKIRVNAIAPGLIDTDFVKGLDKEWRNQQEKSTPMKRLAKAEEVANSVIAIVENMTFITGETIYVDGGRKL